MTTETSLDRDSSLPRTAKTFKWSQSLGYVLRVGDMESCLLGLFSASGSATLQLISKCFLLTCGSPRPNSYHITGSPRIDSKGCFSGHSSYRQTEEDLHGDKGGASNWQIKTEFRTSLNGTMDGPPSESGAEREKQPDVNLLSLAHRSPEAGEQDPGCQSQGTSEFRTTSSSGLPV